ncbi:hypothetical protein D3C86_1869790 [compost metagenome]
MTSSCNSSISNTTSYIKIVSKDQSANSTYELVAKNPYDKNAKPFKIQIDDENVWNLINVDQIYFATYEYKDINKKVELISIKYPSEPNK